MTERIRLYRRVSDAAGMMHDYDPATEADIRAAGYVPALEADTVSRAGHEAALEEMKQERQEARGERDTLWEANKALRSQLTALQAEHNAAWDALRAERDHYVHEANRLGRELAAANARAGRLEASVRLLFDSIRSWGDVSTQTRELVQDIRQQLSTAPQASTEQASVEAWAPTAGERVAYKPNQSELGTVSRVLRVVYVDWDEGHRGSHEPSVLVPCPGQAKPQASTEQASPSPAVGMCEETYCGGLRGHDGPCMDELAEPMEPQECRHLIRDGQTTIGHCQRPAGHAGEHQRAQVPHAQPAPDGTERWAEEVVPTKTCDNCGAVDEMCGKIGCLSDVEKAGPTPAEQQGRPELTLRALSCGNCHRPAGYRRAENGVPLCDRCAGTEQVRPEQAGEYVTVARLVEALRSRNIYHLDQVADRLEGK